MVSSFRIMGGFRMYIYGGFKLQHTLEQQDIIREIQQNQQSAIRCPYDGLKLCSTKLPCREFLSIVSGAQQQINYQTNQKQFYQHMLFSSYFRVYWFPLKNGVYKTKIEINPNTQKLTPFQLIKVVEFIMGSCDEVFVSEFDEKVDLNILTAKEVANCLYVQYVRSAKDFEERQQTYYYGVRRGSLTKVYDKAKQLKLVDKVLTRIESTRKINSNSRQLLFDFIIDKRDDAFKRLVLIDIEKIDKRTLLGRALNKSTILQLKYFKLNGHLKKQLKRHIGYRYPKIDLHQLFKADLDEWLSMDLELRVKIFVRKHYEMFIKSWPSERRTKYNSIKFKQPVTSNVKLPFPSGW